MIDKIKKLLGIGPKEDLGKLIANGAIIVDVRSKGEYFGGHVKGSINIPLDVLQDNLKELKSKDQTILVCCVSGMRSASAKNSLTNLGYTNVINAGSWQGLKRYEK